MAARNDASVEYVVSVAASAVAIAQARISDAIARMAVFRRCISVVPPETAGRPSNGLMKCCSAMNYAVKALVVKPFSRFRLAGGPRFVDNPATASEGPTPMVDD